MTSKLTIEQAKRLRNDFECWQQYYDPKDDKEQYDMFGRGMVAMDMLIAGMYQEPVAYTDERNLGYIDRGRETAYLWGQQNTEASDVALYRHAQSVPVVPEEITAEQAYEIGDYHGDPVDVFARGANWMRQYIIDSTLAAATQSPGSEPATVPGKWIPVSERMPEEVGRYWCYVEEQNSLGKGHYQWNCSWNGDAWSDKALTGRVTHWMPLPAAPQ